MITRRTLSELVFRPMYFMQNKSRASNVKTHRDELLPFTLNNLWDNPGSRRHRRRIGRGPGSTKGKTSGRGHKGQGQRGHHQHKGRFEGGQTPLQRRLPKILGRRNPCHSKAINIDRILYAIQQGRIDPEKLIDMRAMRQAGLFSTAKFGIKLLSRGAHKLDRPLHLDVSDASEYLIKKIKDLGGSVTCVYRTPVLMRENLHPEKFSFKLYDPVPTRGSVKRMERIRNRGAEVKYNVPMWKKEEMEKGEPEKVQDDFKVPVKIYPGVGKDKIRKRKPQIWKTIDYDLD